MERIEGPSLEVEVPEGQDWRHIHSRLQRALDRILDKMEYDRMEAYRAIETHGDGDSLHA